MLRSVLLNVTLRSSLSIFIILIPLCTTYSVHNISIQRNRRSAISYVWLNGIIPYSFDPGFVQRGRELFLEAAAKISSKTCIRFREKRPDDTHWVIPIHGGGCSSHVGRDRFNKNGQHITFDNPGCLHPSIFEHEMGHMMAFPHEQDRPDRDEYIQWDNTLPTCPAGTGPSQGEPFKDLDQAAVDIFYDYVSLMHDWKECIRPKLPGPITIGPNGPGHEVNTFSVLDYEKLNAVYDCGGCQSYRFVKVGNLAYNQNPVHAGVDFDGNNLYICRKYHEGSILVGKSKPDHSTGRKCFIGAEGKEFEYEGTDFEVLTNPKRTNYAWVRRPDDFSIRPNAVIGGRTVLRDAIYIGRCLIHIDQNLSWTPGTIYIGDRELRVPFAGGERSCSDYEILVCNQ